MVQVKRRPVGNAVQNHVRIRRCGIQHPVYDRLDHQRDHCFRYAHNQQQRQHPGPSKTDKARSSSTDVSVVATEKEPTPAPDKFTEHPSGAMRQCAACQVFSSWSWVSFRISALVGHKQWFDDLSLFHDATMTDHGFKRWYELLRPVDGIFRRASLPLNDYVGTNATPTGLSTQVFRRRQSGRHSIPCRAQRHAQQCAVGGLVARDVGPGRKYPCLPRRTEN